jgi:hypothetical protein
MAYMYKVENMQKSCDEGKTQVNNPEYNTDDGIIDLMSAGKESQNGSRDSEQRKVFNKSVEGRLIGKEPEQVIKAQDI